MWNPLSDGGDGITMRPDRKHDLTVSPVYSWSLRYHRGRVCWRLQHAYNTPNMAANKNTSMKEIMIVVHPFRVPTSIRHQDETSMMRP